MVTFSHFPKYMNHTTNLGPLRTRVKNIDHDIVRAQKKVSEGHPKTLSKIMYRSAVTDPQV